MCFMFVICYIQYVKYINITIYAKLLRSLEMNLSTKSNTFTYQQKLRPPVDCAHGHTFGQQLSDFDLLPEQHCSSLSVFYLLYSGMIIFRFCKVFTEGAKCLGIKLSINCLSLALLICWRKQLSLILSANSPNVNHSDSLSIIVVYQKGTCEFLLQFQCDLGYLKMFRPHAEPATNS